MLYILAGPDDFSLNQALEEIKEELGDPAMLATNTITLDSQQVTLGQLRAFAETMPFFGGKRLVIIPGLLARFEARGRTSREPKTMPTNQLKEYQSLGTYLEKLPDNIVLVLIESGIANNNPLFRQLAGKAVVKNFPLLKEAKLRQWIQQRMVEEGGSISSQAMDLLTKLVGSNLWILTSEINKLVLFTSGRRIESADVNQIVSDTQQADVFAMVDAIVAFRIEAAEQLLERLLRRGAAPAYLLFMLSRQFRLIVRARELSRQKKSRAEIQNKLGLFSDFALRKTLEQASRYALPRLREVYQRLLEADLAIKTGKYSGELALNILVAELCQPDKIQDKVAVNHAGSS